MSKGRDMGGGPAGAKAQRQEMIVQARRKARSSLWLEDGL